MEALVQRQTNKPDDGTVRSRTVVGVGGHASLRIDGVGECRPCNHQTTIKKKF